MKNQKKNEFVKVGQITEALPSRQFKVRLEDGSEILAYVAGKLLLHKIHILPGDTVTVELSPYDSTRGRIVYRNK